MESREQERLLKGAPNQQEMLKAGLEYNDASREIKVAACVGEAYNCCCLPCAPCGMGSFKEVTAGHEGLVLHFGVFERKVPPGRHKINCMTESILDVFVRTEQFNIPMMEVITKDTLTCEVDAICYYQVVDSVKASFEVDNYHEMLKTLSISTLRTVIGEFSLDALLVNRGVINARISQIVDEHAKVWGINVQSLEMKDVKMDDAMTHALATVAEARRTADGKIINAKAARDAAELDKEAATLMAENPTAMSIKYMDTMRQLANNSNVQIVVPDQMPDYLKK